MFAGSSDARHECLVVDTNAVIRGVHVERMARELFTVPEVVAEIRDKATREGVLATLVLPQIKVRNPDPDALEQVVAAAKETGDYPFLSEPDIKAVALTLTLFNERNPDATVPLPPETPSASEAKKAEGATAAAGAADSEDAKGEGEEEKEKAAEAPAVKEEKPKSAWGSGKGWAAVLAPPTAEQKKQMKHAQGTVQQQQQKERDEALRRKTARQARAKAELAKRVELQRRRDEALERQLQQREDDEREAAAAAAAAAAAEAAAEGAEEGAEEGVKMETAAEAAWGGGEGSDGEGEWITPDNLAEMQSKLGGCDVCDTECVGVGCVTGDFAMQNVLMHLALDVVGVEGLRLRAARTWMLRCFSCFAFVRDTNKVFCPQCGNSTLQKVAVETRADGSIEEVSLVSRPRQFSQHHARVGLPPPRGGRYSRDAITCEEELQRRLRCVHQPRKDDIASLGFDGRFDGRLTIQQQRKLVNSGGVVSHHKRTGKKRAYK